MLLLSLLSLLLLLLRLLLLWLLLLWLSSLLLLMLLPLSVVIQRRGLHFLTDLNFIARCAHLLFLLPCLCSFYFSRRRDLLLSRSQYFCTCTCF